MPFGGTGELHQGDKFLDQVEYENVRIVRKGVTRVTHSGRSGVMGQGEISGTINVGSGGQSLDGVSDLNLKLENGAWIRSLQLSEIVGNTGTYSIEGGEYSLV